MLTDTITKGRVTMMAHILANSTVKQKKPKYSFKHEPTSNPTHSSKFFAPDINIISEVDIHFSLIHYRCKIKSV